ncbi:MAG: heme o synthase [Thermodesulfovibrionales bacterium]
MMWFIDYIKLTSPGINLLVMLTGFIGMWTALRGTAIPANPSLFLWGLLGIGLASAGSSVFNNCYDRDIDRLMDRTLRRPLPSGRVSLTVALVFGTSLSLASFLILNFFVNALSAVLAALAIFVYAFIYTIMLKRKTPHATEIGGISGALPPVIGWAAVRGSIGLEALILFGIMFLWQPPHFWSLASRHKMDYKNAAIPTMPVVVSEKETNIRSLIYTASLLMVSLLPHLIGMSGKLYLSVSLTLGIIYILLYLMTLPAPQKVIRFFGGPDLSKRDLNRLLFFYSIAYLSLIFLLMAIDIEN